MERFGDPDEHGAECTGAEDAESGAITHGLKARMIATVATSRAMAPK
jgi:hypothetical protein